MGENPILEQLKSLVGKRRFENCRKALMAV